jgi:3-deoxy-7-phosphoheptulonate synthase
MDHEGLIDANIGKELDLVPPIAVWNRYPLTDVGKDTTRYARNEIREILSGHSEKKLIIMGPCSVHDKKAVYEYAERATELYTRVLDKFLILMRLYFEKPRTRSRPTIEWEGLISDPRGDGTVDYNAGYYLAREILTHVVNRGLPVATEFLDTFTPRFLDGGISWAAIGARNAESQIHRHMASGLSEPVGYKNPTSGNETKAIDALVTARGPHSFPGISDYGIPKIIPTEGNPDGHIVLRGGDNGPNFDADNVARVQALLRGDPDIPSDENPNVLIDCSHDNSGKDHTKQPQIFEAAFRQIYDGNAYVNGVMLESHLKADKQKLPTPLRGFENSGLEYGVSVTDACMPWDQTEAIILDMHRNFSRTLVQVPR